MEQRVYRFIGVGECEGWCDTFDTSKRILDAKLELQYISIEPEDRTYVGDPKSDDKVSLDDIFILKSNSEESDSFPDGMLLIKAYPDEEDIINIYYR